jgi:DMSO/TMAO reductase YedYZ molybdopterin-dependent catalytic subunit
MEIRARRITSKAPPLHSPQGRGTPQSKIIQRPGHPPGSFQGVLLWDLLNKAGITSDPKRDGQFQYVEITATDCYQVVLALGEINPGFRGEQVLVADGENGSPLGSDAGFARLIVPGDKFGGRSTFWITSIKVLSCPPPSSSNEGGH